MRTAHAFKPVSEFLMDSGFGSVVWGWTDNDGQAACGSLAADGDHLLRFGSGHCLGCFLALLTGGEGFLKQGVERGARKAMSSNLEKGARQ